MLGKVLDKQKLFDQYHNFLIQLPEENYPHWRGTFIQKNPLDLWMYIEIIQKVKPSIIIETGTYKGGSAKFFSAIQNTVVQEGQVITIDIDHSNILYASPGNSDIIFLEGRSQDPQIINIITDYILIATDTILVSLDAGHTPEEVFTELVNYSPLVTLGSYIVVEDTHIGRPNYGAGISGPKEAVDMFLNSTDKFVPDESCERFGVTYNPGGWLKRVK